MQTRRSHEKAVAELGHGGREVLIEHYLVVFVKFIASIIPTIECVAHACSMATQAEWVHVFERWRDEAVW